MKPFPARKIPAALDDDDDLLRVVSSAPSLAPFFNAKRAVYFYDLMNVVLKMQSVDRSHARSQSVREEKNSRLILVAGGKREGGGVECGFSGYKVRRGKRRSPGPRRTD